MQIADIYLVIYKNLILFTVWNRDELRQALMPALEKLYKQEPESLPFRQPVDPIVLQIPVSSKKIIIVSSMTDNLYHLCVNPLYRSIHFFSPLLFEFQDYFDIVKNPMDLSTIRKRLDTGQYTDPWEYVDDVWLMFSNAWVYNRKNSRVHKYCSKVQTPAYRYDFMHMHIYIWFSHISQNECVCIVCKKCLLLFE